MKLTNLKQILKEKKITQRELADVLHISHKTLNGYISDKKSNEPPIEIVLEISQYLNIPIEILLGINKSPSKEISIEDLKRLKELQKEQEEILKKYI